jgi:hypothetical protein
VVDSKIARYQFCHGAQIYYVCSVMFIVYIKAAGITQNDAQTSHVLTAIAMVIYKSGNVQGAKTVLFERFVNKKNFTKSLNTNFCRTCTEYLSDAICFPLITRYELTWNCHAH